MSINTLCHPFKWIINPVLAKTSSIRIFFSLHYRNVRYYIVNQDFPVIFASEIKYGTL